jgi:ABC-type spermidine/putrescine transport system permease subunit I
MKNIRLSVLFIMVLSFLFVCTPQAVGSSWEWNIMGITKDTIKGRDPVKFAAGVVASLLVHEMGHIVA